MLQLFSALSVSASRIKALYGLHMVGSKADVAHSRVIASSHVFHVYQGIIEQLVLINEYDVFLKQLQERFEWHV